MYMSPPICQGQKKPGLSQLVTRSQKYDYKLVVPISLPLDWGLPVSHPGDTHQHYHAADRMIGSMGAPPLHFPRSVSVSQYMTTVI